MELNGVLPCSKFAPGLSAFGFDCRALWVPAYSHKTWNGDAFLASANGRAAGNGLDAHPKLKFGWLSKLWSLLGPLYNVRCRTIQKGTIILTATHIRNTVDVGTGGGEGTSYDHGHVDIEAVPLQSSSGTRRGSP